MYVLPRRRSALDPWAYCAWMGGAVCFLGLVLWAVLAAIGRGGYTAAELWRCLASGAVWFVSNVAYVLAIDHAGVARANAYKNLTALFGTAFGLWAGERLAGPQAVAAVSGSAAIVAAALAVGATQRGAGLPTARRGPAGLLGAAMGLVAAAGIGYYLVPALPLVQNGPWGWVRYQAALAVFGGGLSMMPHLLARLRGRPAIPATMPRLPLLAGGLWVLGSALVTPAARLIGLAIAWPLSQLSFYVTLLWGVRVFGEIDMARSRGAVWSGAVLTLAALALFGLAKA